MKNLFLTIVLVGFFIGGCVSEAEIDDQKNEKYSSDQQNKNLNQIDSDKIHGEGRKGNRNCEDEDLNEVFSSGSSLYEDGICIVDINQVPAGGSTFHYCVDCGDGICRKEFGETRCNCAEDCGDITEEMYCFSFNRQVDCPDDLCRLKGIKTGDIAKKDSKGKYILNTGEGYFCIPKDQNPEEGFKEGDAPCAEGLTEIYGGLSIVEEGKCTLLEGISPKYYCVKCGDGVCKRGWGENVCNCPTDCE
jgi:hypothetical protein